MAKFNNIIIPGDTEGCGFWRFNQANNLIWQSARRYDISNTLLQWPVSDSNYYIPFNTVMVQRCTDEESLKYLRFLRNIADQNGMRIIFNIDDVMYGPDIVKYNRGRAWYVGEDVQKRIKEMLHLSDFVLVTTGAIREYYCKRYDLSPEKVLCIPNLLPRWWIGKHYNKSYSVEKFKSHKKAGKLRVGIISSGSHYNIGGYRMKPDGSCVMTKDGNTWFDDKLNDVPYEEALSLPYAEDDIDSILETIDKTVDIVQWVIVGANEIRQLKKYGDKIEYMGGSGIIHYPQLVSSAQLDAIVAPCKADEVFNLCKSNIKWLECCALGIPLFAADVKPTYTDYMPEDQIFKDSDDLTSKIKDLTTMSANRYENIVDSLWKWLNSPCKEVGIGLKNWWMEDNFDETWVRIWSIPQRMTEAKKKFIEEQQKPRETLWKSEDGSCLIVK